MALRHDQAMTRSRDLRAQVMTFFQKSRKMKSGFSLEMISRDLQVIRLSERPLHAPHRVPSRSAARCRCFASLPQRIAEGRWPLVDAISKRSERFALAKPERNCIHQGPATRSNPLRKPSPAQGFVLLRSETAPIGAKGHVKGHDCNDPNDQSVGPRYRYVGPRYHQLTVLEDTFPSHVRSSLFVFWFTDPLFTV